MPTHYPRPLPRPPQSFTDRIDHAVDAHERWRPVINTVLTIAVLLLVWSCWPR